MTVRILWATLSASLLGSQPLAAQQLVTWLNAQVDSLVATRIAQRSPGRQSDAPAASRVSTTLLERGAASDLLGLGLALRDIGPDGEQAEGLSVGVTPFALLALARGVSPVSPTFYRAGALARRLSVNVTLEDSATVLGAKLILVDGRNPYRTAARSDVGTLLEAAGPAFGALVLAVQEFLYQRVGRARGLSEIEFTNSLEDATVMHGVLDALETDERAALDRLIARRVLPFLRLAEEVQQVVREGREGLQVSATFHVRQHENRPAHHTATAVVEYQRGAAALTFNGAYERSEDTDGASVAAQAATTLGPADRLTGRDPMVLALAARAEWLRRVDPAYLVQAKLVVPLVEGIELPVSGTWASRSDLVNEARVVGRFGFTLDTSRILLGLETP